MDGCISSGEREALLAKASFWPVCVCCLNSLRAIGLVFTYCVILAQCCHMHTHTLTLTHTHHRVIYLFIYFAVPTQHSRTENAHGDVAVFAAITVFGLRHSRRLICSSKLQTLPFNYLYTLINALARSHSTAPLSFGQFTLIMFGGFNKQNQRLSPNTNQTELCEQQHDPVKVF